MIATSATGVEPSAMRALVHKHLPENVLLSDIRARGDDHFVCTGRVPTDHSLFNDIGRIPTQDVMFYTEVGRQASLAMTHAFFNASLDDVFIFEDSKAAVSESVWQLPQSRPFDSFVIEIAVREAIRRKHDAVCHIVADHRMTVGNEQVFRGTGTWTIQSAAVFGRLRKASIQSAAESVDWQPRTSIADCTPPMPNHSQNVVISGLEWTQHHSQAATALVVDRSHPYFFDHNCDHVPGMLLLEGCAQVALEMFAQSDPVSSQAAILAYDMSFTKFVECDEPTTLTARCIHGQRSALGVSQRSVQITVSQRGSISGMASMTVRAI